MADDEFNKSSQPAAEEPACKVELMEISSMDVVNLAYQSAVTLEVPSTEEESRLIGSCLVDHEYIEQLPNEEFENEEFYFMPGASKRGSDMLIENGYAYVKDGKPNKHGGQRWRCTVRNQSTLCSSSLVQKGNTIIRSSQPHSCTPRDRAISDDSFKLICKTVKRKQTEENVEKKAKRKRGPPKCICDEINAEGFHIVFGGSKRGGDKLVEKGHAYMRKAKTAKAGYQIWRCSVRNRNLICPATIIQQDDDFVRGSKPHRCEPKRCRVHSKPSIRSDKKNISKSKPIVSKVGFSDLYNSDYDDMESSNEGLDNSFSSMHSGDEDANLETIALACDDENEIQLVMGGTTRGGDKLVYNGFSYVKDGKPSKNGHQRWRCTVRKKNFFCNASVLQDGETFILGNQAHTCKDFNESVSPSKSPRSKLPNKASSFVLDDETLDNSDEECGNVSQSTQNSGLSPSSKMEIKTYPKQGFQLIIGGSRRGHDKLVEKGYSYVRDDRVLKSGSTRWRCAVRKKGVYCPANVIQKGETFIRGPHAHKCDSKFSAITKKDSRLSMSVIVKQEKIDKDDVIDESRTAEQDTPKKKEEPIFDDPIPDLEDYKDKEFIIIPEGSARGSDVLIENGYRYVRDGRYTKENQRWRCTVRNKDTLCLASVMQKGDTFTRSHGKHKCKPKEGALESALVKSHIRKVARNQPNASGTAIVKNTLQKMFSESSPALFSIPKLSTLVRATNYRRQKYKSLEPKDLSFEWVISALPPGFVQEDIYVGKARHVIMHTPALLSILAKAETWYVDGTTEGVPHPFQYLVSIHAYVEHENQAKLAPLCFVLMSRKMKRDYVEILQTIISDLPDLITLNTVIMDFEIAGWSAFCQFFPGAHIRGTLFHWEQAMSKKIASFGLDGEYKKKVTGKFLHKLLSLPFLPAEDIPGALDILQDKIEPDYPLAFQELMDYIDSMWMSGSVWKPSSWSVFGLATKMEDEFEYFHQTLATFSQRSLLQKDNSSLYSLIELLYKESEEMVMQCQPITQEELECYQLANCFKSQNDIFGIWDSYNEGVLTPEALLEKVSKMLKIQETV